MCLSIISFEKRKENAQKQNSSVYNANHAIVWIKGEVSKETVVLRRWESIAGNLVLTTELKTYGQSVT